MTEGLCVVPKTRVELHSHLDGSIRVDTIWELSKSKGLKLPGNGTVEDLRKTLVVRDPVDLGHFLAPFGWILPAVQDDFSAIERVAYEYCEDKANDHVLYAEARYSPHAFLSPRTCCPDTLEAVVDAVHKGFTRGQEDFDIQVRAILCTLIGMDASKQILDLYQKKTDKSLVGLDIAALFSSSGSDDEIPLKSQESQIFQEAKRLGIHRTAHAGERGPAEMVRRAVELYEAERIGHGYRVVDDLDVYQKCVAKNIHFEVCPWSSFLTGAVSFAVKKHPVVTFAEDRVNFSLSTDDPTVTGHNLSGEYDLVRKWNFNEAVLLRANVNAINSSFLPDFEKRLLMKRFLSNLGICPT